MGTLRPGVQPFLSTVLTRARTSSTGLLDVAASQVAERLDTEVLGLLRQATGVPAATAT